MSTTKWIVYGAGREKGGFGLPYESGVIGPFCSADEVADFAKREMSIPYLVYDLDGETMLMQLESLPD